MQLFVLWWLFKNWSRMLYDLLTYTLTSLSRPNFHFILLEITLFMVIQKFQHSRIEVPKQIISESANSVISWLLALNQCSSALFCSCPGWKNMAAMLWFCHDHTSIMAKHGHDHAIMTAWRLFFLAWSSWFMAWSWYD